MTTLSMAQGRTLIAEALNSHLAQNRYIFYKETNPQHVEAESQ